MIKNRAGDVFEYGSQKYVIGDLVIGTDQSEYSGLFGYIKEIRDGEDKDTDNETPDIYCNFELPVLETERADLEERFSRLYNNYKTCDDIFWGDVIMAPEMIRPLYDNKSTWNCRYLYLIIEESSDPDSGYDRDYAVYTDYDIAKHEYNQFLADKVTSGVLKGYEFSEDIDSFAAVDDTVENRYYRLRLVPINMSRVLSEI